MLKGLANRILYAGRSQVLGMGAQLIAAAPIIAMSIYLSRAVSLAAVADFALLIGASSVIFTLGMIGLRSRLVLDRFQDFAEADYYSLRMLATGAMALIILIAGIALDAPLALTLAVVFLRIGDAALDLVMAVDQVRREDRAHLYTYLNGSIFKLVTIVFALGSAELTDSVNVFVAFAFAGLIYAIYAWAIFLRRREEKGPLLGPGALHSMLCLTRHSAAFAVAQIICSVLTGAPRLALPSIADRDLAGAAGAALSVATVLGMAFFAVWLRWVPRFGKDGLSTHKAAMFGAEMSLGLAAMLALLWLVGAPMMAAVFALTDPAHLETARATLLASAVFFFVMTLANLFKPSQLPWAESVIYLGGIAVVLLLVAQEGAPNIPTMLLGAAAGMMATECAALAVLKLTKEKG